MLNGNESSKDQTAQAKPFTFGPTPVVPALDSKRPSIFGNLPPVPAPLATRPSPRWHDTYYFADGNTVIQVGNIQFNLHRSLLERHSPKFTSLALYLRKAESPLVLTDVKLDDFVTFLGIVYPSQLGAEVVRSPAEWISILKQAHMWQIDSLKKVAAKHVASITMDPARRIQLYRECGLQASADLLPAFVDLCRREGSISLLEANFLGMETLTKVVTLRESVLRDQVEGLLADRIRESFALNQASSEDGHTTAALLTDSKSPHAPALVTPISSISTSGVEGKNKIVS